MKPKIFISYCWNPESNKQKVLRLAERLSFDGVYVVIDVWDLREGQDKFVFMEKMVNDSSIEKVLLICNKQYVEKANGRDGGVGVEGTIISKQVYDDAQQTKFIPVIFENTQDGKPCLPTFVESKIFIDLSNDDIFEDNYDQLLRNLFDKPQSKRPPIGNMPLYLEDDDSTYLPTANKVRAIKNAIQHNNPSVESMIKDYLKTFIDSLLGYKLDYSTLNNDTFIDEIEKSINKMLPLKEDFMFFIREIINTPYCKGDLFIDFFERMLQTYEDNDIVLYTDNRLDYLANDNYRYFNQDLFLSFSALLFANDRFDVLSEIVKANFIVNNKRFGVTEAKRFTTFQKYNYTFNEYKNKRKGLNRISVTADTIKENAKSTSFKDLVSIDILLYYLSLIYEVDDMFAPYWYPITSCYNDQTIILPKLISKRYFNKINVLFGVNTVDEFKLMVLGINESNIRDNFYYRIPNIQSGLSVEKVCTVE